MVFGMLWSESGSTLNHRLTGEIVHATVVPDLVLVDKTEDKVCDDAETAAAGKPHVDGWRRSSRKTSPEKDDPAVAKLVRAFMSQATEAMCNAISFSCRRRSTRDQQTTALERQRSKSAAAQVVRQRVAEKQRPASSFSSVGSETDASSSCTDSSS